MSRCFRSDSNAAIFEVTAVNDALSPLPAEMIQLMYDETGIVLAAPQVCHAIRMVESGGRHSPPDGDGGRAIGPYQIHEIYWKDAVAAAPELAAGTYQDCRGQDYAEAVIRAYMRKWVADAWRIGDAEVIARTHNGGPNGAQKQATQGYWEKVLGYLR